MRMATRAFGIGTGLCVFSAVAAAWVARSVLSINSAADFGVAAKRTLDPLHNWLIAHGDRLEAVGARAGRTLDSVGRWASATLGRFGAQVPHSPLRPRHPTLLLHASPNPPQSASVPLLPHASRALRSPPQPAASHRIPTFLSSVGRFVTRHLDLRARADRKAHREGAS